MRLLEHKIDVDYKIVRKSSVTDYVEEERYKINWKNYKILNEEPTYAMRMIKEAIEIEKCLKHFIREHYGYYINCGVHNSFLASLHNSEPVETVIAEKFLWILKHNRDDRNCNGIVAPCSWLLNYHKLYKYFEQKNHVKEPSTEPIYLKYEIWKYIMYKVLTNLSQPTLCYCHILYNL